ncbi:sensor histidine kinase [Halopseudomonas salegens]|uniref:histidine kinase n=1 Tax=Halopseudomonas salegens TaxID=1434072 RepID=A0A1H2FMG6_9GAMM|nr:sensor histidine kinase [Halopseudomonas salegens]SDU08506.1 Signal transduction histidine kinase [Halopseudomonas salegens]
MKSISRQLGTGLLLVLLATVILVGQSAIWLFDQAQRDYLGKDLQRESDALLAALSRNAEGVFLDASRVSPDYLRPFSGRYYLIETDNNRWRSRSLWDQRLPTADSSGRFALAAGPQGQQLLVRTDRFERFGQSVQISVALDYQPQLAAFQRARLWLWLLGGLAVLVSLLLQQSLLQLALRPLRQARQEVAEWQAGERLMLSDDVPREFMPLVKEINHLGAQMDSIIQRSRRDVGDLSHALKTPLAVIESLLVKPQLQADDRAVIQTQLQGMRRQLERALQRARLAPESHAGQRFAPATDLPLLITSLRQVHGQHLHISHPDYPSGQQWPFDREDMLELLGNLLDNACKWANSQIRLDWTLDNQQLQLSLEDDGPGISAGERQQATQRGTRLDQSVNGHGLGLAIVRDLVDTYQGQLELQDSPLGGLNVKLTLKK